MQYYGSTVRLDEQHGLFFMCHRHGHDHRRAALLYRPGKDAGVVEAINGNFTPIVAPHRAVFNGVGVAAGLFGAVLILAR